MTTITPSQKRLLSIFPIPFILFACATAPPATPVPPTEEKTEVPATEGPRIRSASDEKVVVTPEVFEEDLIRLQLQERSNSGYWKDKSFEEFERTVYKEPFEGGKYIVNGDTPIPNRKQLEEFFETRVKKPGGQLKGLIVHQEGGQDMVWNNAEKQNISYCVSRSFGSRYSKVVADMAAAGNAWEQVAAVNFMHMASHDNSCTANNQNVVFDVNPIDANGEFLARAFFPNEPRSGRNVLIEDSSFDLDPNGTLQLIGVLRHELGHTLGFRHEHTRPESGACFEDQNWRPLTNYDRFSVMHYPQCNGGGDRTLALTSIDKEGAACLYGAAPGFHPSLCPTSGDDEEPVSPGGSQTQTFVHQRVARQEQKSHGSFAVSPGTRFDVKMTGDGAMPGDPDLYVRFGQAPGLEAGTFACRPFLTGADETCALDVPAGQTQAFVMVRGFTAGVYNLTIVHTPGR